MNDKVKFVVAVFVIALCAYYCVPYGIGAEVTPQTESIDMDIKTGGIRSEPMVEAPAIEKKVEQAKIESTLPAKKVGFWAGFHPDNIEKKHPKINKGWNGYMFVYEHGLRQSLDVLSKVAQCTTPFVVN